MSDLGEGLGSGKGGGSMTLGMDVVRVWDLGVGGGSYCKVVQLVKSGEAATVCVPLSLTGVVVAWRLREGVK